MEGSPTSEERLNKVLAQLGLGSRRAIDAMIEAGRVQVDNKRAKLGMKVGPLERITIDNKLVERRPLQRILLAFNKPKGVTTTKQDRFAKVTVMDFLPPKYRHLYPIGRLDKNSRGLLLLTNDGDLALRLEHPSFEHQKEYKVEVVSFKGATATQFAHDIARLKTEIVSPEDQTKPVQVIDSAWHAKQRRGTATLVLEEGKKRQIRQLFRALGYNVIDLVRIRIATVSLGDLKEGEYVICNIDSIKN